MATYTEPSTQTTGNLITSTIWNIIVECIKALREGRIALASQAQYDLMYASSASLWARIANGTTGQVLVATTSGAPAWGVGPVARYTATLANVQNQSALTTSVSFTIPANTMADGDLIEVTIASLEKNDTGAPDALLIGVTAGAGSNVTVESLTWSASATEHKNLRRITLLRVGSAIYAASSVNRTSSLGAVSSFVCLSSTPTNFTSDFTLAITIDFTAADSNLYFKPQSAKVVHFRS